jgi:putative transposase
MPEHIHLLISEPEHGTPSTVVQAIKLGFARRVLGSRVAGVAQTSRGVPHVSRFFARRGDDHKDVSAEDIVHHRIWERRFYDFNVWTACKRIEKLGYMHRNPVKRGLVAEPDQWTWSRFRAYLNGEPGPVRVNYWEVLDKIDLSRASA